MGASMPINEWRTVAVLLALAGFGYGYNRWVARMERQGHDQGYMGFIVAFGCAVVVGGWAVITLDLAGAVVLLAAFAAAGVPMMAGSVQRHLRARSEEARALREETQRMLRGN